MKSKNRRAIVAVITNDYFHQAVVLWRSIKRFEKESDFILFVIGYDKNDPDYQAADFTVLDAKRLNPQEWKQFLFQYNGLQALCALKSLALIYLLKKYEKVIYLDVDMKLFGPLDKGWKMLEEADLCLTPHSYAPIPNDLFDPQQRVIRLSGLFNAGYIGASRSENHFLKWWWEQTKHYCVVAHSHGFFLDQVYLNDAVYMVERLAILRDYGYNVACWNLHERSLKKRHSKKASYLVNDTPLTCFHFSSYVHSINVRPPPSGKEIFYELYRDYKKEVMSEKSKMILQKKYPFNHFQDGEFINNLWREWMRSGRPELVAIKNPFAMRRAQRKKIERSIQPSLINTEPTLKPQIAIQTSIEKLKNLVSKIISQPCYQEGVKNLPVQ